VKRRGAELVFVESSRGGHWHGRLLARDSAMDRQTGKPARMQAAAIHERRDGTFDIVMQGGHRSGRRYSWAPTLDAAQRALIAWARRRFYVVEP